MWRGVVLVVLAVVVWFVLGPQYSGVAGALTSLTRVSLPLVILGGVLEIASLLCYSALTWSTLNPRTRPGFFTLYRIDLACLGVNNAVPGGGVTATAGKLRMLTLAGTRSSDAVAGTTVEIATSTLALGGIFGLGVALSLSSIVGNANYFIAAGVIAAVALLVLAGTALLKYYRTSTLRVVGRAVRRVPFVSEDAATALVDQIADQWESFRGDRPRLAIAIAWAAANWLLDAAALWVFLRSFGYADDAGRLLVVYGLASILGMLPITPGGLGIVEGVLVPALVGFGSPHAIALLGVTAWRLVQYWLPIPVAGVAYASLRSGILRRRPHPQTGYAGTSPAKYPTGQ